MGIIDETRQENDPRYEANAIPDATDIPNVPQEPVEPVEPLPSLPDQAPPEPPEGFVRDDAGDIIEEPSAVPDTSIDAYRGKPLDGTDFVPLDASNANNGIFPSLTDISNKYQQEQSAQFQTQLNQANQAFQNTALTGASYPSYYEVTKDRSYINQLQEQQDSFLVKPQEELIKKAYDDLFRAIPIGEGEQYELRSYDFGADKPSLNSMRDIEDNNVGMFGSFLRTLGKNTLGLGDEGSEYGAHINPETGSEFAPLRGFRLWWDNFKEDPASTLGSMILSPGSPFFANAKFGDYPGGFVGVMTYGADLIQNIPMAFATDIHRMATGEYDDDEGSSVVQALTGRDYNFSSPQDPEDNDKPFSVLNLHDEAPETWTDIRERSWLWRFPGGIVTYPAGWLFGDELPGFLQDKKILFQGAEFIGGLGLDIAMGGGLDNLGRAGVNWARIRGVDKARKLDDAAKRAVQSNTDPITGLPLDPNDVDNVTNTARKVGQLVDESVDEITGLSPRVPGMITQTGEQARAGTRLEDLTVKRPPELSPGSQVDEITGEVVDDIPSGFAKDDAIFSVADDVSLGQVPKDDIIYNIADDVSLEQVAKTPTGIIEEGVSQKLRQNVPPRQLVDEAITPPNVLDITTPKYDFPSTKVSDDGTLRLITPLNDVPTNPLEFKYLNPEDFDTVRRTNAQLTDVAKSQILVPPSRQVPLSSTRLNHLNDVNEGLLSRYGRPLDDMMYTPPKIDPDLHHGLRVADDFADNIINAPILKGDVIKYQRAMLPSELHGVTDKTIRRVSAFIKTTDVYDGLASETAELGVKLAQEKSILNEAMQRLDEVPDIGRRTMLDNPPVPKPSVTLDVAPQIKQKASNLAKEINAKTFYHGSKAKANLAKIDPVEGAARSELGVGIHFTSDQPLALEYAAAGTTRNLPPVPGRQLDARGYVYQIKPKVSNPIDANAPIDQVVKNEIAAAISESSLPSVAKTNLKRRLNKKETLAKFYKEMDEEIEKVFVKEGLQYPEEVALDLQRRVTQNLRSNLNVDSILYRADIEGQTFEQLTVLGKPDSLLISSITPSVENTTVLHQSIARSNVDTYAAKMFPNSKYAQTNAAESKVNFMTQFTQRTSDQYDDVVRQTRATADELVEQQRKLKSKVKADKAEVRAKKEAQWNKQNETQLQHWNTPEDGLC